MREDCRLPTLNAGGSNHPEYKGPVSSAGIEVGEKQFREHTDE